MGLEVQSNTQMVNKPRRRKYTFRIFELKAKQTVELNNRIQNSLTRLGRTNQDQQIIQVYRNTQMLDAKLHDAERMRNGSSEEITHSRNRHAHKPGERPRRAAPAHRHAETFKSFALKVKLHLFPQNGMHTKVPIAVREVNATTSMHIGRRIFKPAQALKLNFDGREIFVDLSQINN